MLKSVFLLVCLVAETCGKKPPNFIFFQPDEMRAESLGCYGHPVASTPNFDRFAAEATRFDQAHVSYTVCSQSRASFATGWPTHVAGHRSLWSLLHDWEPNFLKYFKQAGYTVKYWGKNDMLAADAWNASVTSARSMPSKGHYGPNKYKYGEPGYYSFLYDAFPHGGNETGDATNVQAAIDFLNSKPDEPFVIFLPLSVPHPPYSAPEPWYSSVDPDSLPALRPADLAGKPDYFSLIRKYRELDKLDDAFFRKLQAVYLGSISYSDHLFGRLLDAIQSNGLDDSTTVAVWADHGDYAGDYGLVEKWPSGLEDVLTRVPLIIRTPGGAKGHVVKEPVQLYDIVPTWLELANITAQHVLFAQSLVPQLQGLTGDPKRTVFAEGGYGTFEPRANEGDACHDFLPWFKQQIYYPKSLQQKNDKLSVARSVSARTMTHKLVIRTDPTATHDIGNELYDLRNDSKELVNLYNDTDYSDIKQQLQQQILTWFMQTSDALPWALDGRFNYPPRTEDRSPFTGGQRGPHDFVESHDYDKQGDWPELVYHV